MQIVKKPQSFSNEELFPYCNCERNSGCNYISKIFHHNDYQLLCEELKSFEIFDVNSWKDLEKFGVETKEIKEHFQIEESDLVIPVLFAKKADDEFNHFYSFRSLRNDVPYIGNAHWLENGTSHWGWCILDTDDENVKVIGKCSLWYPKK